MLRDGILKENIDGEALLWANSRVSSFEVRKKLIIVLSDGAPVDDATLSVNPSNFLFRHAAAAGKFVQSQPNVKLVGVGIGQDISPTYENSTFAEPEQLGAAILDAIRAELQRS
jgi:cobaltochelatase CobT